MRWIIKAAVQDVFSLIPGGRRLNRMFQGDVSSHLIPGHMEHLRNLERVLTKETRIAVEIGTGWCPTIPLGLTARNVLVHTYDQFPYVTEKTKRLRGLLLVATGARCTIMRQEMRRIPA